MNKQNDDKIFFKKVDAVESDVQVTVHRDKFL